MEESYYKLIEILEASVKKNGADKILTLGHLLAIIKIAEREANKETDFPYCIGDLD